VIVKSYRLRYTQLLLLIVTP